MAKGVYLSVQAVKPYRLARIIEAIYEKRSHRYCKATNAN
ncbi:hypothetical protein BCEN4_170088 [Burkholderia cenocepacia]|nr:hypothetical protein BCEN4_170088 [Burkholderia cenocepacia]